MVSMVGTYDMEYAVLLYYISIYALHITKYIWENKKKSRPFNMSKGGDIKYINRDRMNETVVGEIVSVVYHITSTRRGKKNGINSSSFDR